MATEQPWGGFSLQPYLLTSDTVLVGIAGDTAGARVPGADLLARRTAGGNFLGTGGLNLVTASGATCNIIPDASSGANGVAIEASFAAGGYGPLRFLVSGGEGMRVIPGGRLLVGTPSEYVGSASRLAISYSGGTTEYGITLKPGTNTTTAINFLNAAANGVGGITVTASSTAYNTSSDYRLKEDRQPVGNALTRLCSIPVWNFAWKATGARTDGFYAHELAEVVPCAVTGEKDEMQLVDVVVEPERVSDVLGPDGKPIAVPAVIEKQLQPKYQGIDQAKLVPLLTAAVQELAGMVEQMQARLAALEASPAA